MAQTLLVLGLKSAILICLALLATRLAARSSAATRHLVLSAAMVAALALPLLGAIVPPLGVEVLPARTPVAAAPALVLGSQPASAPRATKAAAAAPVPVTRVETEPTIRPPFDWTRFAVLLWAAGALALVARAGWGWAQLGRIARRAQPLVDEEWQEMLGELVLRLDIGRNVALFCSAEVEVPMTWGVWRPCVVVPASSASWSVERRRAVLVHELAHVERFDALTQLLAGIACAIHWPNPLAWMAARAMRNEREHACDDRVLEAGSRASDYAQSLLDIARHSQARRGPTAALAMACRSQLEGRLIAVLDPHLPRRGLTRRGAVAAATAAAVLAVPLAALEARETAIRQPPRAVAAAVRPAVAAPAIVALAAEPALAAPVLARPQGGARMTALAPAPRPAPQVSFASGSGSGSGSASSAHPASSASAASAASAASSASAAPSATSASSSRSGSRSIHLSNSSDDDGQHWTVSWTSDDGESTMLQANGKVSATDDVRDLVLSPGASVDITVRQHGQTRHVTLTADGNRRIQRVYLVNGHEEKWDPEWFAGFLTDLDRQTGFAMEARFPRILEAKGPSGVLDEVEKLGSDYTKGLYLKKLLGAARLNGAQMARYLRVAGTIGSDYERANALLEAAQKDDLSGQETRAAFLGALKGMSSDYELGRTLRAILEKGKPAPGEVRLVLDSVSRMGSDYERAQVLIGLADRKLIAGRDLVSQFLKAAGGIGSDYEHARTLKALASASELDAGALEQILAQAASIGSDYERATLLLHIAQGRSFDGSTRAAYQKAAMAIGSDYERGRALAAMR